ncbi:sugar phosphate isomerase/epimerase family protein [Sutcliffiella horikoshii]|uniref:sugar phosphate isomerase/epimerase family protein n=1 Tax=Sutcliffiella horikoshii TaxID=79883 RepID=UPI001F43D9A4|nr:sugar phosphate isomerase/epimerase [Sutcliffiella horikoshii]MCG1021686.1 sugar phosphate isomerase/epimerase [Sutcliffiella horikoshii]
MKHKIAAQLYTVRDFLEKDFIGVLKELKDMGFAGVEMAGLYGHDPKEIAAALNELELSVAGMHVGVDRLRNELPAVLDEAELFGTKHLVMPYVVEEDRTEEYYVSLKAELNELAPVLKKDGYTISYHNHDFEFEKEIDGKVVLEYLLEPSADNLLHAELDVYWVTKAGRDVLDFLSPLAGRVPTLHMKDMAPGEEGSFAEVGTGVIDFEPVLRWGEENGVQWYIIEQDVCPGNPLDSLRVSIGNLKGMMEKI